MKTKFWFFSHITIVIQIGLILLVSSCEDPATPVLTTVPVLTTNSISDILPTTTTCSATCGGNISDDGGAFVAARGVCWAVNQTPTIEDNKTNDGDGTGFFKSSITGLMPETIYAFRAFATNSAGTGYGNLVAMTTPAAFTEPSVITSLASIVTESSARCEGKITSDGGKDITVSGICWNTAEIPTIEDSCTNDGELAGSFGSIITGLAPSTKYYFRAYAKNSIGTGYGTILSFSTSDEIKDIDGNIYHSVIIGDQVWMVENLKVTHYRNGEKIPNVTGDMEWAYLYNDLYDDYSGGAYCAYNNNKEYADIYGYLYNWNAVDNSRGIAPDGWHVPTHDDWIILLESLRFNDVGGKMKEIGTAHWKSPNTGATNESGFTALPGGFRKHEDGKFYFLGFYTLFWSTPGRNRGVIENWWISNDDSDLNWGSTTHINAGYSVRLIRD